MALRWLLQRDIVASVITGVLNTQQLDENMGAANGWTLTPEEVSNYVTDTMPVVCVAVIR